MKLVSRSIQQGRPIDGRHAFGVPHPDEHMTFGRNLSPHIAWEDLPAGTSSLALICHDPDAPSSADDVNQEGRSVPAGLPRVDFFHWLVVDIDPQLGELEEGAFSEGVSAGGKGPSSAPHDTRVGVNDYTDFLAGNPELAGTYWGYDGPCPPWNDEIVHRYVFTLYALDIPRVAVTGEFRGGDLRAAIEGHVIGDASIEGTYNLNPAVPA